MAAEERSARQKRDPYLVETILKNISDVVNSIDDVQAVMDQVVHLTTELLAVQTCSLVMIEPDGQTLRMGAAYGLPSGVAEDFSAHVGEGITGYVAQTGKPLLIEDVETHPLFARKSKKQYTTKSLLSVPLLLQDETIAVLNVNNRNDGGIFTRSDELLLSVLANFVVITIEKAQMRQRIRDTERYEADLRVAREIQQSMLPQQLPELAKWEFGARHCAAHEVAGDFFDIIPLPENRVCLVVGDVCGKGVPAAVYMARVLGFFRMATRIRDTASEIVSFVNDFLAPEWTARTFVTAMVGIFDGNTGKVSFCSAGHHNPICVNAAGEVSDVDAGDGFPLGVEAGASFTLSEITACPGDTFVCYTDGVTEATDSEGEMFRKERLDNLLQRHAGGADELAATIVATVSEFAGDAPQSDDITLVTARRR